MKRLTTLCALVAAAACGDTATQPDVATDDLLVTSFDKAQKIDICHYDEDTGQYSLKSIPLIAESSHRGHGDGQVGDPVPGMDGYEFDENCQPFAAEPMVFAIAYTNLDGTPGFDPATDVLIAKLVDGNNDNMLNEGDQVVTAQYPINRTPTGDQFASFLENLHTVAAVHLPVPGSVEVTTTNLDLIWFDSRPDFEQYFEQYYDPVFGYSNASNVTDWLDGSESDAIIVIPGSPSQPTVEVIDVGPGIGDQGFIDVRVTLPSS